MSRARTAFTAYYVPSWYGRAKARRVRAKTIGDVMRAAQTLLNEHTARVVTVFPNDVTSRIFSYDVMPNVTRITWRHTL